MTKLFLLLFVLPLQLLAQRDLLVVIEGSTQNFLDKKPIYGVNVDLIQNDAVLTKVLADESGQYYVSARIVQGQDIQLRFTKGAYLTKLIAIDLSSLKGQTQSAYGLKLNRNLVAELYPILSDVDLGFAKNIPTDKYVWSDASARIDQIVAVKSDADAKASAAYQQAIDQKKCAQFQQKYSEQIAQQNQAMAIVYLDSILQIRPNDAQALNQKQKILDAQRDAEQLSENKAKQSALLDQANAAMLEQDYNLAQIKYKEADAILPGNQYIQKQLAAIEQKKVESEQNKVKSQAFQKAMQAATSLINSKRYDEAIKKLNEALQIQPSQKDQVEVELRRIREIKQDILTETELKKLMKLANDQYVQKKYDLALESYKKAYKQIALFHKQTLIDNYSKELQTGLSRVTAAINSVSQVYQDQLAKANENFLKGPQFYSVAKNILNSDPMKSKQNEIEVIELKEKISAMESFYADRKNAYSLVKSKDNEAALKALENVYAKGQKYQNYIASEAFTALKKSADSLRALKMPADMKIVKVTTPTPPTGISLSAPGQLVTADNSMSFNSLSQTQEAKKEAPYQIQQQIRTEVEYRNYFAGQNAQIGSFETSAQLELIKSQREIKSNEAVNTQAQLQLDQQHIAQATEVAIEARSAATSQRQQENAENLNAWKDEKDYKNITDQKAAEERQQYELDRLNIIQNQKDLKSAQDNLIAEQNVRELNQRSQDVEFHKQIQEEQAIKGGMEQYVQIQQVAASKVELKTTPNYIRDENGVLFPPNTMTEKTYQITNKEGYVIKVIIRRVVVDANGYGVVYEQTTDEHGKTYFTRDGQVSTEYVWFNDSTGANVLIK